LFDESLIGIENVDFLMQAYTQINGYPNSQCDIKKYDLKAQKCFVEESGCDEFLIKLLEKWFSVLYDVKQNELKGNSDEVINKKREAVNKFLEIKKRYSDKDQSHGENSKNPITEFFKRKDYKGQLRAEYKNFLIESLKELNKKGVNKNFGS